MAHSAEGPANTVAKATSTMRKGIFYCFGKITVGYWFAATCKVLYVINEVLKRFLCIFGMINRHLYPHFHIAVLNATKTEIALWNPAILAVQNFDVDRKYLSPNVFQRDTLRRR